MKILFAVICCEYKNYSLKQCFDAIKLAAPNADLLINYEVSYYGQDVRLPSGFTHYQGWGYFGDGKNERKFDQDQGSRLTPICIARNMVMDYAQQGNYDWLIFVDSDIIVPDNVLNILENPDFISLRSGVIPGRGIHSNVTYSGTQPQDLGDGWIKSDYFSCGLLAIPKQIFWRTRFRWGMPQESDIVASEDPIFGSDCRHLGYGWFCKKDVICQHVGELRDGETSQF